MNPTLKTYSELRFRKNKERKKNKCLLSQNSAAVMKMASEQVKEKIVGTRRPQTLPFTVAVKASLRPNCNGPRTHRFYTTAGSGLTR